MTNTEIYFQPLSYIYIYKPTSAYLVSVTSILKELMPKFDSRKLAEKKASGDSKGEVEYYISRWKLTGEEASVKGKRVHLYAQHYPNVDAPADALEQGVENFFKTLPAEYEVVGKEVIFNTNVMAGTIDLVVLNKTTGAYILYDFKTDDKDLDTIEWYHEKNRIAIFDEASTALNKYKIQLNLCKFMAESKGISIEAMRVVHLHPTYVNKFEIYEMEDLAIQSHYQKGTEFSELLKRKYVGMGNRLPKENLEKTEE